MHQEASRAARSRAPTQVAAEQKRGLVVVRPGTYPKQTVPAGNRPIIFKGDPGAKLRALDNAASGVTFSGLDVDAAFAKTLAFHNSGNNASFRNGRIGNVTDEKGALVSGTNFTFDNVVFHDVELTDPNIHNECLYAIVVPGMKLRNSTFMRCATMDAFFTYGSWWNPLPPAYGNVTIENNVFAHSLKEDDTLALLLARTSATPRTTAGRCPAGRCATTRSRSPRDSDARPRPAPRWTGNIGGWNCVRGVTLQLQRGREVRRPPTSRCSPASSTQTTTAPFGWVNPAANDFRLKAGSPALNVVEPERGGAARPQRQVTRSGAGRRGARALSRSARHVPGECRGVDGPSVLELEEQPVAVGGRELGLEADRPPIGAPGRMNVEEREVTLAESHEMAAGAEVGLGLDGLFRRG